MKKSASLLLAAFVATGMFATAASADVAKGQKLYLKKLKTKCNMNGAKMAAQHTQDEWEVFMEDGKLADELSRICPNGEKIIQNDDFKEKIMPHIYDFLYEYGSDSGNVPSC